MLGENMSEQGCREAFCYSQAQTIGQTIGYQLY